MPNPNSPYSAHGSHTIGDGLRVYHQGGLDTYCAFYAMLNLVNFLKYKENNETKDFIGDKEFEEFIRFIDTGTFRGFFPEKPFGDCGPEAPMLVEALRRTLLQFNLRGTPRIEECPFRDPYLKVHQQTYFRPGTERLLADSPNNVLGLVVVMEADMNEEDEEHKKHKKHKKDEIGHWVVFVGRNLLGGTGITCSNDWNGIVLDSDRGYEYWKIAVDERSLLRRVSLSAARYGETKICQAKWIYSFISVKISN